MIRTAFGTHRSHHSTVLLLAVTLLFPYSSTTYLSVTMSSHLERLPADVLRIILVFAANTTTTLLRCERVFHAVEQVVQDDRTWESLPRLSRWKDNERFTTNRLAACARIARNSVHREHRVTGNIIVQELGVDRWSSLVTSILSSLVPVIENRINENT